MQFITISTLPLEDDSNLSLHRQPRMMRESIAAFDVPLQILGKDATHDWSCWYRIPILIDFLRPLNKDEIVLFTDGWDAFFCGKPVEMEEAFRSIGQPVVVSAETNLWPKDVEPYITIPDTPTRWKYACGGGWAGYAGALLEMFSSPDFRQPWTICDQAALECWTCNHTDTAVVDYNCKLFVCGYDDGKQNPHVWSVLKAVDGRVYNSDTNSYPLVIHGGGGFCDETMRLWEEIKGQRAQKGLK